MEYEIIEEIEACYSQTILSMYTIYVYNEIIKNVVYEYSYKYITGKITFSNNNFNFTISLPMPLSKIYETELYNRIDVLNKQYEKGFFEFLQYSGGYWYEQLKIINIYSILGILDPFRLLEDKQSIQFILKCRNIDSMFPQKWLNLYFYEYRKHLPVIYSIKKKEYEENIEKLKKEYLTLRNQINIYFSPEDFMVIHKRLEHLKLYIETPFEEYYRRPKSLQYTPNDNKTFYLLKTYGYKIV